MIRQTVLPFRLKRTKERNTARSGFVLFAEFFRTMRVEVEGQGYFLSIFVNRIQ